MIVSPNTNITGIFQSDLIIKSAIEESLARIRANPSEIDYIFQSLNKDKLTAEENGQKTLESFKNWFLSQDVPVSPSFRVDETKLPIITYSLNSSDETDQTLGDIHYVTAEDTQADWPVVAGPFNPIDYAASSGIMTVPDNISTIIVAGMALLDRNGRQYPITENYDDGTIQLAPFTSAEFDGAMVVGGTPKLTTSIESVFMKEVYQIGVHVQGEPFYLIALHSILIYALQKYKEELLEAREFERSVITNTEFRRNQEFAQELVFSRWLNIAGYIKDIWAKRVFRKIDAVEVQPVINEVDGNIVINAIEPENDNMPEDQFGLPASQSHASILVRHQ